MCIIMCSCVYIYIYICVCVCVCVCVHACLFVTAMTHLSGNRGKSCKFCHGCVLFRYRRKTIHARNPVNELSYLLSFPGLTAASLICTGVSQLVIRRYLSVRKLLWVDICVIGGTSDSTSCHFLPWSTITNLNGIIQYKIELRNT